MTDNTALKETSGHALENIAHWATVQGDEPWLVDLADGEPTVYTWAVAKATIDRAAIAVHAHFGGERRKAAVLSKNRAHWIMADMGILRAGAITVPVFTTMRPETFHYVLDFAGVELL